MDTTTIRVDRGTHARLRSISTETGDSLIETVRQATDALQRLRFGLRVQEEFDVLRRDPQAWTDYLAEAESSHVADGID